MSCEEDLTVFAITPVLGKRALVHVTVDTKGGSARRVEVGRKRAHISIISLVIT